MEKKIINFLKKRSADGSIHFSLQFDTLMLPVVMLGESSIIREDEIFKPVEVQTLPLEGNLYDLIQDSLKKNYIDIAKAILKGKKGTTDYKIRFNAEDSFVGSLTLKTGNPKAKELNDFGSRVVASSEGMQHVSCSPEEIEYFQKMLAKIQGEFGYYRN